jgi:hypothetical protein
MVMIVGSALSKVRVGLELGSCVRVETGLELGLGSVSDSQMEGRGQGTMIHVD